MSTRGTEPARQTDAPRQTQQAPRNLTADNNAYEEFRGAIKARWPDKGIGDLRTTLGIDRLDQIIPMHGTYSTALEVLEQSWVEDEAHEDPPETEEVHRF